MPCWFRFTVKQPCSRRGYGYVYGYESFPGLPGAPLAACTQAATPLQAQTWGGGRSLLYNLSLTRAGARPGRVVWFRVCVSVGPGGVLN